MSRATLARPHSQKGIPMSPATATAVVADPVEVPDADTLVTRLEVLGWEPGYPGTVTEATRSEMADLVDRRHRITALVLPVFAIGPLLLQLVFPVFGGHLWRLGASVFKPRLVRLLHGRCFHVGERDLGMGPRQIDSENFWDLYLENGLV